MSRLRESARDCPYCMACYRQNPNRDQLCLAHSNRQQNGKGMGIKSRDEKGAICCHGCHDLIDGRTGDLSRSERQALHTMAHLRTVDWWVRSGHLTQEQGIELKNEANT